MIALDWKMMGGKTTRMMHTYHQRMIAISLSNRVCA